MASVRRVKYGEYVVRWPEADGTMAVVRFKSWPLARAAVTEHADATLRQDQGEGPSRYEVRFRDSSGRQHEKRFRRKADADRFAVAVEAERARGTLLDPQAGRITFQEYAEQWLTTRRLAATTREQMEIRYRLHINPVLGHLRLSEITPEAIQRWLATLTTPAESTRTVLFSHVSAVLAFAADNGRIPRNPCAASSLRSSRPRPSRRPRPTPWTADQVAALYAQLPQRYAIYVALGAGLGLRQGEVFGLSPDDIDWATQTVRIRRQVLLVRAQLLFALPKGSRTRDIPMSPLIGAQITRHLARFPARKVTLPWSDQQHRSKIADGTPVRVPLILTSRESRPINRNYFNTFIWKVACKRAGVESTRENGTHALRHHYASVLLDAGENIVAVSEYLGHHDPAFTLRTYTHIVDPNGQRARDVLSTAMSWLPPAPGSPIT